MIHPNKLLSEFMSHQHLKILLFSVLIYRTKLQLVFRSTHFPGLGIWGVRSPLHKPKIETCKKNVPCLIKKLQGVQQIACLKQQCFLSPTFSKIQKSYEKIMCICYFIDSVVKVVLYLHFLYTKDNRLRQIKKETWNNHWWNNHFSDIFT